MGITFPQFPTPWLIHFCKAEVSLVQVPPSWQNFSAVKVSLCSSFTSQGLSVITQQKGWHGDSQKAWKNMEKTKKIARNELELGMSHLQQSSRPEMLFKVDDSATPCLTTTKDRYHWPSQFSCFGIPVEVRHCCHFNINGGIGQWSDFHFLHRLNDFGHTVFGLSNLCLHTARVVQNEAQLHLKTGHRSINLRYLESFWNLAVRFKMIHPYVVDMGQNHHPKNGWVYNIILILKMVQFLGNWAMVSPWWIHWSIQPSFCHEKDTPQWPYLVKAVDTGDVGVADLRLQSQFQGRQISDAALAREATQQLFLGVFLATVPGGPQK